MTDFQRKVVSAVNQIPGGSVVSYGQVASHLGSPRGARQVGWVLRSLEGVDFPWWRVINNQGRISIKGNKYNTPDTQRNLLLHEGVKVNPDMTLDIEKYRFLYPV